MDCSMTLFKKYESVWSVKHFSISYSIFSWPRHFVHLTLFWFFETFQWFLYIGYFFLIVTDLIFKDFLFECLLLLLLFKFISKVVILLVEASLFNFLCSQFTFMLLVQWRDLFIDYFFEVQKYDDCILAIIGKSA